MRVKIIGFEFSLSKNMDVGDFYRQLESVEYTEVLINTRNHVLLTDVIDDYICGVFITYKNNKRSISTLLDKDGDLAVDKRSLDKDRRGTEANIFCINPSTQRGLLYSYAGAASPTSISAFLKAEHKKVRNRLVKEKESEITNCNTRKVEDSLYKAGQYYKGDFSLRTLTTPAEINQLIDRYAEINQLVIRSVDALSDAGVFAPIDMHVKKAHVTVDFDDNSKEAGKIKKVITSIYDSISDRGKAIRLIGLSHSGEELSLAVGENSDSFGFIDYDDYVDQLPSLKWKDYVSCEALTNIIDNISSNSAIFGNPACSSSWKKPSKKDFVIEEELV